jgi:hypothetical protein
MGCKFAQRETANDTEKLRCVNKACGSFLEIVDLDLCAGCPLNQALKNGKKDIKGCPGCPKEPTIEEVPIEEAVKEIGIFEGLDALKVSPEESKEFPSLSTQLWNYQNALKRWQAAGRPVRDTEEVENILETHCKGCDWYDKDSKRCKGCGCKVTAGSMAIFNKIKMATEHCPQELW